VKSNKKNAIVYSKDDGEIIGTYDDDDLSRLAANKEKQKQFSKTKRENKLLKEKFGDAISTYQNRLNIASKELSYEDLRMLILLLSICDFQNEIMSPQKELASEIKTTVSNISRAINSLSKKGYVQIIKNNGNTFYRLPHEFAWKGKFEKHKEYLL
jgi:DNA-binding MarR family transcriptional regulator